MHPRARSAVDASININVISLAGDDNKLLVLNRSLSTSWAWAPGTAGQLVDPLTSMGKSGGH